MNRIEVHLWVAAVLQWLVASSNLFAARIFAYREELAKLSPFVREVFIVQNIYIMTTVAMFGIVSIVFTPELAGGSALAPTERMKGSGQKMPGPPKNSNHARHEDLEPKTWNHGKHGDSRNEDRVASEERTGAGPTPSGEIRLCP